MKSKQGKIVIAAIAAVIVIAGVIFAVVSANRKSSLFGVENRDDGTISVTAQNAAAESSGQGYITLAEGQVLSVRTNLTDRSSIKIEVLPREMDTSTGTVLEETFSAIDARTFELPQGQYTVRITASKGAEGSMEISPK